MIFMRPWFLLLILAIPFFFHLRKKSLNNNPWKKFIKPEFLPFLMIKTKQTKKSKNSLILISLLWTILCIALAGPAFEKAPTKVNKNDKGTVLIVDLNSLNKTTLTQLKIKLSEVVKQLKGERIGLVLYDEKGYVALPMTEDKRIVEEMIPVLDPSVLPAMGNKTEEGFKTAIELLQNNNLDTGRILFFTGGITSSKNTAQFLDTIPYSIGILGFGNGEKTPILAPNGQFKRDKNGNIILTNLNKEELQKIGILELWRPDDSDIISLLEKTNSNKKTSLFNNDNTLLTVDTYKDIGIYLLLFAMPFIALFYRKGFFVLIILISSTGANASLWLRDDQILYNTNTKAIEAYKNKDYLSALAGFKRDTSETGIYNQANATAHMKRYQEAIDLYKQVLEKNPNHEEARFNKAYLEQMMKNNESSSQKEEEKDNQKQEKNGSSSDQNNNQGSNNLDQKESDTSSNTNNDPKQSENSSDQNTDSESKKNNLEQNAANDSNNLDEKNKDSSNEQQQERSDKNENDQIYPPKEEQTQSDQKEKEEQPSPSTQNNNQQGQITEETENENPIDQTSQEIFNRLKKDPSRLLRYRLYEQNRRKP